MSRSTVVWIGVILACVLVAGVVWALITPTVSSEAAASAAVAFKGGTAAGWRVKSETLTMNGNRPPQALIANSNEPRCWGGELPLGVGCLPYPMWEVVLQGPTGGCPYELVLVDGRKGTVAGAWGLVCITKQDSGS